MEKILHRSFFLNGPAGRLEALLWTQPAPDPAMVAVVCHPHPLFGGTLHNKVVYRVAKSLHHLGLPVLRFNFRGAGRSEGAHDQGRGEQADVAAALDFLAAEFPGKPVVLGGFSFGAFVGLRVACTDARVARVIGLGLPVNRWDMSPLRDCVKPKLLIQGGNDEYGSAANVESLFVSLGEPKRLVIVPGADHFFAGGLERVDEAIRSWMSPPALQ
jgi:hypothetical protein